MRPYEAHPFSRLIDLIIINRPLLTNFGLLRARFFNMYALYVLLFNFNFAKLHLACFLCFISFSVCFGAFSRASSSRAAVRLTVFLIFFFTVSRALEGLS
jgi:hypothetical protein